MNVDVDQNSSKLIQPCTSDQANYRLVNYSDSVGILSAISPPVADVSSCSKSEPQATVSQDVAKPQVLTVAKSPLLEESIFKDGLEMQSPLSSGNPTGIEDLKSSTNTLTLSENKNNEDDMEQELSQSNNESHGITPPSDIKESSADALQQTPNKNTQTSTCYEDKNSNINSDVSVNPVVEPDVILVTKNCKVIESNCLTNPEIEDKASAKPPTISNQDQNEVPNKNNTEAIPNLNEPKKSTSKESNSSSSNPTPQKSEVPFHQLMHIASLITKKPRAGKLCLFYLITAP